MPASCPTCGNDFVRLGLHWLKSACPYPVPTTREVEIFTGMLMGDASLATHDSERPYLRWNSTNRTFLEYVDESLGVLTTGVSLVKTAEEAARRNEKRTDRDWPVRPENYRDIYLTRTRRLPCLKRYKDWYVSGEKRFPGNLRLTPRIAKYWYAGDGTVNWMRTYSAKIQFVSQNERDRPEYIKHLFHEAGFDVKQNRHMYYLSTEDSARLLQWMGDPVPGFEYKWEVTDRDRYEELKDQAYRR